MLSLTIVIPTYNEVANIDTVLRRIAEVAARESDVVLTVAVVDDSSPDGTADAARRVAAEIATGRFVVRVLQRAEKNGLGAAYIWAFGLLLGEEEAPDYILQMDADLSHDPRYIADFLAAVRSGAELVVASRYIPGGGTPDWSFDRKMLSRGGNLYTRMLLGRRLTDWTGGFNLFSAALLRRIRFETIDSTGYGFQIALKHRAVRATDRAVEIPIVFLDRTLGTSKIPGNTLRRNLFLVFGLRFGRNG
ncbi:polyprenol monophosphomannose synthase [Microbacteriaceae bacterium VKM Ac-2855]|nr:polyprenol monophosphomannose synthase [Microbacteriaceae bacterium VKM Ac-2855]